MKIGGDTQHGYTLLSRYRPLPKLIMPDFGTKGPENRSARSASDIQKLSALFVDGEIVPYVQVGGIVVAG
jgi:hypothetical protein